MSSKQYVWYHEGNNTLYVLVDGDMEEMAFRFNCGLIRIGDL